MSVRPGKGGNISLSKAEPGLANILIGLGWDVRLSDGADFDLDASAFLLGPGDRVRSDEGFIFHNNLRSADGADGHTGDNCTGAGDGDDEALKVDLARVPPGVQKIAIAVTSHEGEARRQSFGTVSNAFIRIVNDATGREISRYDLAL